MVKRLLDANASDFKHMSRTDLIESIKLSEGRVVVAEIMAPAPPLIDKISNIELAAGMGADMILLNLYDLNHPQVAGFPDQSNLQVSESPEFGKYPSGRGVTLKMIKEWIGRPVGINLEPLTVLKPNSFAGRLATPENAQKAKDNGSDFIVITANPYTGITTAGLIKALEAIRSKIGRDLLIFVGKMHAAGTHETMVKPADIPAFAMAGADGLVLPAPGTVPGTTVESIRALVEAAHSENLLVMNGIGTSQEGASINTIEQLALMSKMSGADMHHIGDAGTLGIAVPENITAWSIALRGRRHTWHRMCASLLR